MLKLPFASPLPTHTTVSPFVRSVRDTQGFGTGASSFAPARPPQMVPGSPATPPFAGM